MKTQEDRELDRFSRKRDEDDDESQPEFTLGTGSLLGLFLALVVICGVFFGLGYSMGRRSGARPAAIASAAVQPDSPASQLSAAVDSSPGASVFENSQPPPPGGKPSAEEKMTNPSADISSSTPAASPGTSAASPAPLPSKTKPSSAPAPSASPAPHTPVMMLPVAETPLERQMEGPVRSRAQKSAAAARKPSPIAVAKPTGAEQATAASPAGHYMVQVAAVAGREDADILASALRRRGYAAVVRNEPYDKLLHVQVGPFASRAQANATRSKLIADGYNAFLKP